MSSRRRQSGFGAIAAIVVLVILALLSAAIVSISTTQQITSAQDVQSAKAWQAARAGNEWGLYKALKNETWSASPADTCITAPRNATLDLSAVTGFYVTVSCASWPYNEGETVPGTPSTLTVYQVKAVACPVAAGCPALDASAAGLGYVERTRVVLATNR
ncbi:MAG: biosis protein MshP [Proteobacteria bacterium]|nr:biosis protein MshP [Pseudomonadota bacterium]